LRQGVKGVVAACAAAVALCGLGVAPATAGPLRAGAATVDASWHVGSSAGQYATTRDGDGPDQFHDFDPGAHSYKNVPSYGVQSRLQARAIVVEGPDGTRFAVVKNDLYIPQDLLWRRTAQLLEAGSSGIDREHLTMNVSHDHSSPYYSSTGAGAWTFQDVFDVRFYEYYARQMATAVEQAAASLRPVRVSAARSDFDKTARNALGPAIADDGTPAGFPNSYIDRAMSVVRFDEAASGKPVAVLVNYALHPEFLSGNDLISADFVAPLQRLVDRETEAVTIWSQSAVGNSEPERSTYHSVHERLEFSHKEYVQAEYGARLMADEVVANWRRAAGAGADVPAAAGDVPVGFADRWFGGPLSHPYPSVSNCRTDKLIAGEPQVPVAGLPDCTSPTGGLDTVAGALGQDSPVPPPTLPIDPGLSIDDFQAAGIEIIPENYGAPSYGALQEDASIHLQAFRIGDILFTVCSCEQWADQSLNIKSRTDRVAGNQANGYDWGARCSANGAGGWTCPNPRNEAQTLTITDEQYRRMRAQVLNDATGWNDPDYVLQAESEPVDTTKIKGNYTHDDTAANATRGYAMTVPISMANDYNGYIATYREYQRGDHYRKALTGWGPHSSDYLATRLVGLGRALNGAPAPPVEATDAKVPADLALNDQKATALGGTGGAAIASYESSLPDDGGQAEPVRQPADVERFGAAVFTWNGGSNFTDNPVVSVERRVGSDWQPYADQSGEVPVILKFPAREDVPAYRLGDQRWEWTASFEALVAPFALTAPGGRSERATPAGTYRFVVNGRRRQSGAVADYRILSREFTVRPWSGITAEDVRRESDGTVSFRVGPRRSLPVTGGGGPDITAEIGPVDYPDSYTSPARFIREQRTFARDPAAPADPAKLEWYCLTCTFRPWLDAGDAAQATVTFVTAGGGAEQAPATKQGDRWVTARSLGAGEAAFVGRGCVQDAHGNFNGAVSAAAAGGAEVPGGVAGACPTDTGPADPDPGSGPGGGPAGIPPGGGGPAGGTPGGSQVNRTPVRRIGLRLGAVTNLARRRVGTIGALVTAVNGPVTRVVVTVRDRRGRLRGVTRIGTLRGSRRLIVRLNRRLEPGRYTVVVTARGGGRSLRAARSVFKPRIGRVP